MMKWCAAACAALVLAMLFGCMGGGTPGMPGSGGSGGSGSAKPTAAEPKSAAMTKEEFRKKKEEIAGKFPTATRLKVRDLYEAFGKPSRTSTVSGTTRWYWTCRDGMVEVEFADLGKGFGPDDPVMIWKMNDY